MRVVTEAMPSVRSVALGFWIRRRLPRRGQRAGRHLALPRAPAVQGHRALQLARDRRRSSTRMGAEVNAGTGKETTSVYSRFLDGHLERAFDVMAGHGAAPALRRTSIPSAQVVIEEIAMYEDEPSDKVHDVLAERDLRRPPARAADHRPRRRGRRRCRSPTIAALPRRAATCPRNIVVAAAGNVDHDALVRAGRGARPTAWPRRGAGADGAARRLARRRALPSQGHRAVPPLPRRAGHARAATSAASRCACWTRSSAAPPPRGCSRRCARSAGSPTRSTRTPATTRDSGQVGLYVGTRPDNVAEAIEVIGDELRTPGRRGRDAPRSSSGRARTSRDAPCCRWSPPRRA